MIEALFEKFDIHPDVVSAARRVVGRIPAGADSSALRERIEAKVLRAFFDEGIAAGDLAGTLGYGNGDVARDRYELLLARVLGAERALARLTFVSGTHAIVTSLAACVMPGQRLVVAVGRPYDTLRNAVVDAPQSLVAQGITCDEVSRSSAGGVDFDALEKACATPAAAVFVQRSRGYASRRSLSARECGEIAHVVKRRLPQAVVIIDNCYGELVELTEPLEHGADIVVGSLIKNLGGCLAPGGGYVAGRAEIVERVAVRHYAPGLGAQLGSSFGFGRELIQGLFQAPQTVAESLAGLDFAAALFAEFGYPVDPLPGAQRRDIVQAIRLGDATRLLSFARGLQRAMPLDARFTPEPGPVPGYADPVVMSGGAFIQGATVELSCDAPLREPYEVYFQGGASRRHVALGALLAADRLAHESVLLCAKKGTDV